MSLSLFSLSPPPLVTHRLVSQATAPGFVRELNGGDAGYMTLQASPSPPHPRALPRSLQHTWPGTPATGALRRCSARHCLVVLQGRAGHSCLSFRREGKAKPFCDSVQGGWGGIPCDARRKALHRRCTRRAFLSAGNNPELPSGPAAARGLRRAPCRHVGQRRARARV